MSGEDKPKTTVPGLWESLAEDNSVLYPYNASPPPTVSGNTSATPSGLGTGPTGSLDDMRTPVNNFKIPKLTL